MSPENSTRSCSKSFKYFFYRLFVLFATLVHILFLTPVLILIIIPLALYRKLITLLAPITNPSLGKILSTGSSFFTTQDFYTNKSTTISGINVVKGRVDIQKFSEEFQQKLLNRRDPQTHDELVYPEFRQNVVRWMGYSFWKDLPNFSLSDCLISYEESQKVDFLQGEWNSSNVFQRLVAINGRPWDPQKPLWRLIFLPYSSQSSEEDTLFIILLHHSLADGFSCFKAFLQCMGINNPKEMLQKVCNATNSSTFTLNILSGISYALSAHYDFLYYMIKSFDFFGWKGDSESMSNPNCQASGVSSGPFPLQRLKDIKDKFGVSLSTVAFAILTAGLRRGLLSTTCKEKSERLPKKIHLLIPLPVPGHPDKLRNHLTYGVLSLPVGDPDPISRIQRLHRSYERLKASPSLLTTVYIQKILGAFPVPIVGMVLRNVRNVSASLTNLPGPPSPMSLCGCPIQDSFICGNTVLGSVGVASSFTTYNGTARLSVGGLQSIFPTQQIVEDILATSMKEIDVLISVDEV